MAAWMPAIRRVRVEHTQESHGVNLRRACRGVGISVSSYPYKPDLSKDDEVIAGLQKTVEYPAYGYSKLFTILRRWGQTWNHKRIYRIFCQLKLNKRRRGKKRLPTRTPEALVVPALENHCWSLGFVSDSLMSGRRF